MNALKRIPLLLAWIVVLVASGLIVLEESGLLVDVLRTRLAARLGPLGSGLTIDHVALRWLEPGVVVEGLTVRAPLDGVADEAADEGTEGDVLLHVRSVHVSLAFDREQPLARVHVDGGRIRIGDRLFEGFEQALATLPEGGTDRRRGAGLAPPFVLTDFAAELELPDGALFELGQASLAAQPASIGGYELYGRIIPTLSGAVPYRDAIYVDGKQWETGLEVRASVNDLSLASGAFRAPAAFGALPIEEFAGELTLDATTKLDWSGDELAVEASLRAAVARARLAFRTLDLPVEDLQLDLAADFELAAGRRLWDRDAWSATTRMGARWAGSPVVAHARFGRDLPAELWAHAWARAAEHPLTEETPSSLGASAQALDLWRSLGLEGHADVRVDVRLPTPTPVADGLRFAPPRVAVEVVPATTTGDAAVTYHGLTRPDGRRFGIPIRADVQGGSVLAAYAPSHGRLEVGLVGLRGRHETGTARVSGLVRSPRPGTPPLTPWDMELLIDVPRIAIDRQVEEGLAGNAATEAIWRTYAPGQGTLSSRWRLHSGEDTEGLTAAGDVTVQDASVRWAGLPVTLRGTSGTLRFLWEGLPTPIAGEPLRKVRPFGMVYDLGNVAADEESAGRAGAGAPRAHVHGFVRQETLRVAEVAPEDVENPPFHGLTVEIEDLLLRGSDWDTIVRAFPEAGEQADAFKAKGGVRVRFTGLRSSVGAPYRSSIEVTPNVVEVTPDFFPHRTRDLSGRILVRTEEDPGGERALVESDVAVSARWLAGGELGASAHASSAAPGTARVLAAGVDPRNTAFKGALYTVLAAERSGNRAEGLDPSAVSLEGHVDFAVDVRLEPGREEPETKARAFLRENGLTGETLRLERLRGVLEQDGDVLRSDSIYAELAEHALELRDVRVFSAKTRFEGRDPLLDRPRVRHDPDTIVLQSTVHVHELPLDMEHLSKLVDEEKLSFIRDNPSWRGFLDLEGTRFVLVGDDLFVQGTAEPRDVSLRMGVPIRILNARLDIEELVFEGDRIRGWAQIEDLNAELLGRELADARMILTYVDGRLSIDNLSGAFEGGRLEPLGGAGEGTRKALSIGLAPPYRFDLALQMSDVDVDRMLSGVFSDTIEDRGRVDGGIQLRGSPSDVLGISGSGWVRLRDGQLWSIPVMRELFGQLGFDRTAVFDRMRGRFDIADGRIESSNVAIRSALLNLIGRGWLDLDGTLHYDLEARYGLVDRLGPFNRFVYWLNNSLWRIVVRGDMNRPQVHIRNSVLDFLRNLPDDPPRQLPLPGLTPLPERF